MKRFLSIFIALILVLSLFSVTVVAFADGNVDGDNPGETEVKRVTFETEPFNKYVFEERGFHIEMDGEFMLDGKVTLKGDSDKDDREVVWYKNSEILHEIFPGIRYIELKDEVGVVKPDADGKFDESVKLYTLEYVYNLPKSETDSEDNETEEKKEFKYQATEHVTLAKAPEIKSKAYKFQGWKIEFPGSDEIAEFKQTDYFFAEDFVFNMPELKDGEKVTVTAQWKELVPVESEKDGDEAADSEVKYEDVAIDFYANDKIYVLYCGPNDEPRDEMKNWKYCDVTSHFPLTTEGWWGFRFAVVDGVKSDGSNFKFEDDVLVTSYQNVLDTIERGETDEDKIKEIDYTLWGQTDDTTHPVVELSNTLKDQVETGLTAGKSYTVSTSLDIKDASSTTVTFEIWKKVSGEWVLIYDGNKEKSDERITEGYEDFVTVSGSTVRINPVAADITGEDVYKIVYFVVDAKGWYGVKSLDEIDKEYNPEMLLRVYAAEKTPEQQKVEAWKIVLYVVAGLAAVGIVVLLFIKPKQTVKADDPRINAGADANAESKDSSDDQQE